MKNLFRTTALTAALALSAFAMAGHATGTGICHTICRNPTTHQITQVNWTTTEQECCSGTVNPCPPGFTGGAVSFSPAGGGSLRCPA